ncbi:unnamed protein product [Rangifer tarandus platyrhynchus]|uniref:Uncharacterized protein n=2 Tax=Rangifer tarandus platyrhynchus TaxID=3082113 RepID=A0ABN8YVK4_RANTA|nr:unnamed protein product [Rangifer tarandus platyrhynchus]CAI9702274.1 unnamed protein product [Rangifer tarandus platyrhynchus]
MPPHPVLAHGPAAPAQVQRSGACRVGGRLPQGLAAKSLTEGPCLARRAHKARQSRERRLGSRETPVMWAPSRGCGHSGNEGESRSLQLPRGHPSTPSRE